MEKYHGNTIEHWKQNAEEDYVKTPLSVLKYITVLEEHTEYLGKHAVVGQNEQLPCDECVDGQRWSPYYGKYVKCNCRKYVN